MYEQIETILHFEFGFYTSDEGIEIIAIDHSTSYVRTLGICQNVSDAVFVLETCIQFGFRENGMVFEKIPGYRLKRKLAVMQV